MNKPILALDFDQILANYTSGFIGYVTSVHGYQLNINSGFDDYNLTSWFLNMNDEQFRELIVEYNDRENPPLFPYIKDVIPKLQEKYDVIVITSYSDCERAKTRRAKILIELGIYEFFILGLQESKLEVLQEIGNKSGENVFVDDSPKHILEGLTAGWDVATISYPYNQGIDGVKYMNSLCELLEENDG